MTTSSMTTPKIVILSASSDWDEWLSTIFGHATHYGVWKYIDPDEEDLPPIPELPVRPSVEEIGPELTLGTLTHGQLNIYNNLQMIYKEEFTKIEGIHIAMRELYRIILNTISRQYYSYLLKVANPKEMLAILKQRVAPTDRGRELDVARRYRGIIRGPQNQQTEKWLQLFEKIVQEATQIKLPETEKNRPIYDFLDAIETIDPGYAKTKLISIQDRTEDNLPLPTIERLIDHFRTHRKLKPAKVPRQTHSAFAATFQGQTTTSTSSTSSYKKLPFKATRPCICGEIHFFRSCKYLIEHLREPGWTPNPQIIQFVSERLKTDQKFAEAVQKAKESAQRYRDNAQVKSHTRSSDELVTNSSESEPRILGAYATLHQLPSKIPTLTEQEIEFMNSWILDCGSDTHLCNDRSKFTAIRPAGDCDRVKSGLHSYPVEAYGTCTLTVHTPAGKAIVTLLDVALVPGYWTNLVSLHRFVLQDIHLDTLNKRLQTKDGKTFCWIGRLGGHWIFEPVPSDSVQLVTQHAFATRISTQPRQPLTAPLSQWHIILGHPAPETLQHLQENTKGAIILAKDAPTTSQCETCSLSKAHTIISRRNIRESPETEPMERVSFDMIQMKEGYNAHQWITHFYCPYTSMHFIYSHSKKSQITSTIQEFVNLIETRFNKRIRFFHTDTEQALGKDFLDFIAQKGITLEQSAPYTPAQNGSAERAGGTLLMKARSMRIHSRLPASLWPEIIKAAGYLTNRTPTRRLEWKTPFEALTGQQPDLSHMHIYGCRAYPLRYKIPRTDKVDPRAHIGYLVGYDSRNIYRIWIPSLDKVICVRDVTFNNTLFFDPSDIDAGNIFLDDIPNIIEYMEIPEGMDLPLKSLTLEQVSKNYPILPTTLVQDELSINQEQLPKISTFHYLPSPTATNVSPTRSSQNDINTPIIDIELSQGDTSNDYSLIPLPISSLEEDQILSERSSTSPIEEVQPTGSLSIFSANNILPEGSKRTRKQKHLEALRRTHEFHGYFASFATAIQKTAIKNSPPHRDQMPPEPISWKYMLLHPYAKEFRIAASREYANLQRFHTFSEVPLAEIPMNYITHSLPLTWAFKYKFDDQGYVVKFKSRLCVRGDLQFTDKDTYAATLASRTFRALMAITAAFDLECLQYDITNAFVNAEIDEDIFCKCPDGFEKPNILLKLRRALYGLKQSPRLWFQELSRTLETLGLEPVLGVDCLFANEWLLLFFYVDDILILFHPMHYPRFHTFEDCLRKKYELRALGPANWFLGIQIIRNRQDRKLWLNQSSYVKSIATRFHLTNKPNPLHPLPSVDLVPNTDKATAQQILAFQQRIGSINFAAVTTRPDVAFAASKLARFLLNPSSDHLAAANQTITYLFHTSEIAIQYTADSIQNGHIFYCAADAAFADDKETRYSSDGYVFFLFGGPVDWKAARQQTVTLSSTEAELLSLTKAAKEIMWWRRFFTSIHFHIDEKYTLHCDNQQTIRLLDHLAPKLVTRLRHIDIHQHWLRQQVQRRELYAKWLPTAKMPADGLTKGLSAQNHLKFISLLNLIPLPKLTSPLCPSDPALSHTQT